MPNQAPGYYRHTVGDLTVTALNDGILALGTEYLLGIEAGAATAALTAAGLPASPVFSLNAFLVQRPGLSVLIDAGAGGSMGPGVGHMRANLAHAGVAPEDIDTILVTHMHPDHIGGLLDANGAAIFPRARLLVPQPDSTVFLDPAIAETVPDDAKPVFAGARAVAAAYDDRLEHFETANELRPGITPVPLPGHSPGHTGYRIQSGGESLLIWGDIVHVPGLQFRYPDVGMVFDTDPALAQRTRRDTFAAAAASRELVAGMHMPFPALFRVATDGEAFRFTPLLWNPATTKRDQH